MLVGVCDFPGSYAFPPAGYGGIERWESDGDLIGDVVMLAPVTGRPRIRGRPSSPSGQDFRNARPSPGRCDAHCLFGEVHAAVGAELPSWVVRHFPRMPVRVDEHARVPTPESPGRLAADDRTRRPGLVNNRVDFPW